VKVLQYSIPYKDIERPCNRANQIATS
jgi:hypothetical protein